MTDDVHAPSRPVLALRRRIACRMTTPAHAHLGRLLSRSLTSAVIAGMFVPCAAHAASLTVAVKNLRSDAGQVRCGLFDSAEHWRIEDRAYRAVNADIRQGRAVCDFGNVPAGDYAVAAFHAERGEERISYGLFGKPKQGVAFSNNPSITFGAPDFGAARVPVSAAPLALDLEMKY